MEKEKYIIVAFDSFMRLDALLFEIQDIVSEFRTACFDCVTIEGNVPETLQNSNPDLIGKFRIENYAACASYSNGLA